MKTIGIPLTSSENFFQTCILTGDIPAMALRELFWIFYLGQRCAQYSFTQTFPFKNYWEYMTLFYGEFKGMSRLYRIYTCIIVTSVFRDTNAKVMLLTGLFDLEMIKYAFY